MAEEWIVQVQGREYGPVDLEVLREWKQEGRVLPTNQARRAETNSWITAAEIPGLFDHVAALSPGLATPPGFRTFAELCGATFRLYRRGIVQFTLLTLLVVVPSACSQLMAGLIDASSAVDADLRTLVAAGFSFCMLLTTVCLWPIYIAGIQLLTADLRARRPARFFALFSRAIKFWPRVAILCVFVYGSYLFWTILPVGLILGIAVGTPSVGSFFLALLVFGLQVWIVGRLYINFMFWQQFAVIGENDLPETLRNSKALARSKQSVGWYKRPLWRGVFVSSLWFLFVLGLNLPLVWPALQTYVNEISKSQDLAQLAQTLATQSKTHGFSLLSFGLGLLQALLRPLLGIAFVLLYFDDTGATDKARD